MTSEFTLRHQGYKTMAVYMGQGWYATCRHTPWWHPGEDSDIMFRQGVLRRLTPRKITKTMPEVNQKVWVKGQVGEIFLVHDGGNQSLALRAGGHGLHVVPGDSGRGVYDLDGGLIGVVSSAGIATGVCMVPLASRRWCSGPGESNGHDFWMEDSDD